MELNKKYGLGWIYKQTKGTRAHLALFFIFILANALASIAVVYFLRTFIDIATGDSEASLLHTALYSIALVAVGGIFTVITSILAQYIFGRTERSLRAKLMDVIFSRRMVDISRQHTGELLTKLTIDVQAVSNCFVLITRDMAGQIATALIATAAMFFFDWRMALVMLGLAPLMMIIMGIFMPFAQKVSEIDKENEEVNRSLMQENLSRIMLIKTYFLPFKTIAKMKKTYTAKLKSGMKLGKWEGLMMFCATVMAWSMVLVIIGVGAYFVLRGDSTLGNLMAIVQLSNYVINPIANISVTMAQISQAKASSARIGTIYELPADNKIADIKPVDALELIAENLNFAYINDNDETVTILEDVTAVFEKGKVIGIAGKSGSGKSTLLKVLIGLYAPHRGDVKLKYTSGTLSNEEIMTQVAYVPPVDYLFSGTVTENIIMSGDTPRPDDMRAAAASANILDFIESLPAGFDTPIGESGGTVSSGQAQRLAIARAKYKDSPIIVFDEPTANLDVASIALFQSAVKNLAKDKICIIVTHDVSTITVCDKVYVIDDGYIREKLDGEELVFSS